MGYLKEIVAEHCFLSHQDADDSCPSINTVIQAIVWHLAQHQSQYLLDVFQLAPDQRQPHRGHVLRARLRSTTVPASVQTASNCRCLYSSYFPSSVILESSLIPTSGCLLVSIGPRHAVSPLSSPVPSSPPAGFVSDDCLRSLVISLVHSQRDNGNFVVVELSSVLNVAARLVF